MFLRILPLFVIIALGFACGALGVFDAPRRSVRTLNRLALYVAFPALVFTSLASPQTELPNAPGFYVAHIVAFAAVIIITAAAASAHPTLRRDRGAIVLVTIFGNIAYLGIPVVTRVFGAEAAGLASLSAGIHVTVTMVFGPLLLLVLTPGAKGALSAASLIGRVARQPLFWSPILGLLARRLPMGSRETLVEFIGPIAAAAAPVALFMIGLYLFCERRKLRRLTISLPFAVLSKLVLYPAVAVGVAALVGATIGLTEIERAVFVMMAAMPVAITTFSIGEEFRVGEELAAMAIITSTLLSVAILPLLASFFV